MLQFKTDDITAVLILTLTEQVTITDAYYLFAFTHVLTKRVVKFIKSQGEDESAFKYRYNKFTINPAVVFLDEPIGQWHYTVYQQASAVNTDETLTEGVLEYGKMILNRAVDFAYIKYNEPTIYSAYNG